MPELPYVAEALTIFVLTDVVMLLLNGIPVQVGGVGNDACNLRLLRKSIRSKRGIVNQLRANALIQEGVPPKDIALMRDMLEAWEKDYIS